MDPNLQRPQRPSRNLGVSCTLSKLAAQDRRDLVASSLPPRLQRQNLPLFMRQPHTTRREAGLSLRHAHRLDNCTMEICDGIAVIGKHPVPRRRSQPELEERRQSFSPTARGQPHSSSCHSLMLSQQRLWVSGDRPKRRRPLTSPSVNTVSTQIECISRCTYIVSQGEGNSDMSAGIDSLH